MEINNKMYELYEEMITGYRNNEKGLFEHGARSWMSLNPDNPFIPDTKESECFFRIKLAYQRWLMNGVDKNINRKRMLDAANALCELNPVNPYQPETFKEEPKKEKKKVKEEPVVQEAAEEEVKEEESHAAKVFGVVDKGWFVKDKEAQEIKASRLKNLFKSKD